MLGSTVVISAPAAELIIVLVAFPAKRRPVITVRELSMQKMAAHPKKSVSAANRSTDVRRLKLRSMTGEVRNDQAPGREAMARTAAMLSTATPCLRSM